MTKAHRQRFTEDPGASIDTPDRQSTAADRE
jgi:hypothetical protein